MLRKFSAWAAITRADTPASKASSLFSIARTHCVFNSGYLRPKYSARARGLDLHHIFREQTRPYLHHHGKLRRIKRPDGCSSVLQIHEPRKATDRPCAHSPSPIDLKYRLWLQTLNLKSRPLSGESGNGAPNLTDGRNTGLAGPRRARYLHSARSRLPFRPVPIVRAHLLGHTCADTTPGRRKRSRVRPRCLCKFGSPQPTASPLHRASRPFSRRTNWPLIASASQMVLFWAALSLAPDQSNAIHLTGTLLFS